MLARFVAITIGTTGFLLQLSMTPVGACTLNRNGIGVSRTLSTNAKELPRLGTLQYAQTLPLADKEIVLTFDDGPLPPHTNRILDILSQECTKATYFIVGGMARAYPDTIRRIYAEGHTIGTHSQNHPLAFNRLPISRVQAEVENGVASVTTALGNPGMVAPFFRIPGLARSTAVEQYLEQSGLQIWSVDFQADDWRHISASEIVRRALRRIEAKQKGVLLLHDIHPATVQALPNLLAQLKLRNYRIVQVLASPDAGYFAASGR